LIGKSTGTRAHGAADQRTLERGTDKKTAESTDAGADSAAAEGAIACRAAASAERER
jgi:hypothetical protein